MPKDCRPTKYPPGTFRYTDLRDRLNLKGSNDGRAPTHPYLSSTVSRAPRPRHPQGVYHGGSSSYLGSSYSPRPPYYGARPKVPQSRISPLPRFQSGSPSQGRNLSRPVAVASQVNIHNQTLIVSSRHEATHNPSDNTSSVPASSPKTKEIGVQTDIYYSRHRTYQEVSTHIALMEYLNITQKTSSTQTCEELNNNSPSLLDFYSNTTPVENDVFFPLSPTISRTSLPVTSSYSEEISTLDECGFHDVLSPNTIKSSYDFDLESYANDVPLPDDSNDINISPSPNLLLDETNFLFHSLSVSGAHLSPRDLDQTPLLAPTKLVPYLNIDTDMENVGGTNLEDLDESI